MLRVRGFEGTQSRISEIRARMEQLEGRMNSPKATSNFQASLDGKIGKGSSSLTGSTSRLGLGLTTSLDSTAPFDPVAMGLIPGLKKQESGDIRALASQVAEKYGIDPALFSALIQQESGFNPSAVSPAGAQGLTQLMPKTGRSLGVTDPFDPKQNLEGGAKYLAQMLKEFGGDRRLALAAYNAGPGAVKRHGGIPPFAETQNYVKKILDNLGGN